MELHRFDSMNPKMVGLIMVFPYNPICWNERDEAYLSLNPTDQGIVNALKPYAWENGGNLDVLWTQVLEDGTLTGEYIQLYCLYCFEKPMGLDNEPNRVFGKDAEGLVRRDTEITFGDVLRDISNNRILRMVFPQNVVCRN